MYNKIGKIYKNLNNNNLYKLLNWEDLSDHDAFKVFAEVENVLTKEIMLISDDEFTKLMQEETCPAVTLLYDRT